MALFFFHYLSDEGGGGGFEYFNFHYITDFMPLFREDDNFILRRTAAEFVPAALGITIDKHLESFSYISLIRFEAKLYLQCNNLI